jgi:hypothetical protein
LRFYLRHFLLADALASALVTGGIAVWALRFGGARAVDGALSGDRAALYGTLASVFGALLGFIIATIAILVAVVPDDRLVRVRASNQYATVWSTLTSAMRWLAASTAIAVVLLIADRDAAPVRWLELLGVWIWLVTVTRLTWSLWILDSITKLLSKSRE